MLRLQLIRKQILQSHAKKCFTNKQQALFAEVFCFFDANQDGQVFRAIQNIIQAIVSQIEQSELMGLMKKLGVEVSEKDLEDRILEFDKDNDGTIDFNEVQRFNQHQALSPFAVSHSDEGRGEYIT